MNKQYKNIYVFMLLVKEEKSYSDKIKSDIQAILNGYTENDTNWFWYSKLFV